MCSGLIPDLSISWPRKMTTATNVAMKRKAAACVVIALLIDEEDKRKRRGPDREWIKRRRDKGAFANIVMELMADDLPTFNNFVRMDYMTFQALVDKISYKISKNTTVMRKPISASERVALTLRFLATEESFTSLEFQFRTSSRAISSIVFEVCEAIHSEMADTCLSFPATVEDWKYLEKGFQIMLGCSYYARHYAPPSPPNISPFPSHC